MLHRNIARLEAENVYTDKAGIMNKIVRTAIDSGKPAIMAARVYLSLLPALFALVLSACSPSPEEYALERTKLAKAEDILAKCRLFVLKKGAKERLEECRAFQETDEQCEFFPEQKEGCTQFINAPSYTARKLKCQDILSLEKECIQTVNSKIPSWFYDFADTFGLGWKKKNWIEQVLEFTLEIHIGIVYGHYVGKSFLRGVDLAVEEINNKNGVLGRDLVVVKEAAKTNLDQSRAFAKKMRENPKFRAVIGSHGSGTTIALSNIYESGQLVYLAVFASRQNVIRQGNRFIFRLLPNTDKFSNVMVEFCMRQNFHNLALLYTRDDHSEEMAKAFRAHAIRQNLTIVFEKSFFRERENFMDISTDMKELEIDAIFLTGTDSTAARVVQDIRDMGIKAPIIGSQSLDSDTFAKDAGKSGNGTVVPTIYNPFASHPENTAFIKDFREEHGWDPNTWAAQGYDAVKLLAYVMKEAKSTVPTNIATRLRYMPPKNGATGKFAFEKSGELAD
ncbi:MAG: ABC transporter substrate-binding protein, partial [Gammaproteobacteria bacterium]|nr:ABC transporter substrate-binding protein [Gammaproteobacteria bacterium]